MLNAVEGGAQIGVVFKRNQLMFGMSWDENSRTSCVYYHFHGGFCLNKYKKHLLAVGVKSQQWEEADGRIPIWPDRSHHFTLHLWVSSEHHESLSYCNRVRRSLPLTPLHLIRMLAVY